MERHEKPLSELMRDLVNQVASMIRHELGLARAEMSEKASQASSGVGMLAAALALGMAGLVILLMAGVFALDTVMEPWAAALIVGGAAVIVAWVLVAIGKSHLRARNLMPSRTLRSVQADVRFAKEKVS
ncbi:MAG: phage holin family protein [Alphaproteobacteria bacterium]